jgi:NAD(P)H-flavin reductase
LSLHSESAALNTTQQTEQAYTLKKPEHSAVIQKMTALTPDVLEIIFKLETDGIEFIPGQFILVRIKDNLKINRAYSISKYDPENSTLRVTVKKVPNGYGTDIVFNSFKVGDKVMLEGTLGYELIVDKSAKNILLVAGGIGVTPFIPILEDLTSDVDFTGNVQFIYGVNKENELIYRNDIEALVKDRPNFKFTPVVAFEETYQGEKGFVTNVIEKLSLDDTKIYMCGPKPMVVNTEKLLDKKNFDKKNLFVEAA